MSTATEEIKTYLVSIASRDGDSLQLALQFARSMSQELRLALQDWESAVDALEQLKVKRDAPASN